MLLRMVIACVQVALLSSLKTTYAPGKGGWFQDEKAHKGEATKDGQVDQVILKLTKILLPCPPPGKDKLEPLEDLSVSGGDFVGNIRINSFGCLFYHLFDCLLKLFFFLQGFRRRFDVYVACHATEGSDEKG